MSSTPNGDYDTNLIQFNKDLDAEIARIVALNLEQGFPTEVEETWVSAYHNINTRWFNQGRPSPLVPEYVARAKAWVAHLQSLMPNLHRGFDREALDNTIAVFLEQSGPAKRGDVLAAVLKTPILDEAQPVVGCHDYNVKNRIVDKAMQRLRTKGRIELVKQKWQLVKVPVQEVTKPV